MLDFIDFIAALANPFASKTSLEELLLYILQLLVVVFKINGCTPFTIIKTMRSKFLIP
ncbi:unnamed protein product [Arabidopsis thaliana]|uniref:Uncharacterized protein n=1 Tax=Arabidopsis thaliana TaxID=3702 RepID=A0A5S9WL53_ARATH|nr:unnamed protein product [Arabidopsis thaliana]